MSKFVVCGKCSGLKQIDPEPHEHKPMPYSGSRHGCDCPDEGDDVVGGKWTKAEGKWAIKGCWEQLPLWNQSELDQI